MSRLYKIPSWVLIGFIAFVAYSFIAGFLDSLPPAP